LIYALVQHAPDHEHSLLFKIVSSDKDLKQMLCDNVVMYDAMKQEICDVGSFEERW
jgi:5'-3' exonuclease